MSLRGKIIDAGTSEPVQGVSILVVTPDNMPTAQGTTTNSKGDFILDARQAAPPNVAWITHVSYQGAEIEIPSSGDTGTIALERKQTELDPVIITSTKKNNNLLWAGLLLLAAVESKKRKAISGTAGSNSGTTTALIVGGAAILGFSVIKKIFEGVGFWDSKNDKDVKSEIENPNSPFSPNFWKASPSGALLVREEDMQNYLQTLYDSFDFRDDDEAQAIGVFKKFKTKSQVSFFSDFFQQRMKSDLLSWLRGSSWPNDRLDSDEIANIINYVDKLPNYKP